MAMFKKEDPRLEQAQAQIAELAGWLHQLRGEGAAAAEAQLRASVQAVQHWQRQAAEAEAEAIRAQDELNQVRATLVDVRETATLQEVGVYEYAHPLQDALAYKDALAELKQAIKAAAKSDAVACHVDWAVNGSVKEGQRLGRDIAKLMLRAYNTEADNAVRSVKPHTRDKVKERLTRTRHTVAKLGALMQVSISGDYHRLRLQEIDLTADYLMRVQVEKEAEREERARLREEAKVLKEIERERARLAKERSHYEAAVTKLRATGGDESSLVEVRAKLAELDEAMTSVDARAANVRTGYVYVISNVGAFGADVVKIGMTRRLEPMDRVRELGDASVPFRFDVHALFFSEDAVALESALHKRFADKRVNLVNMRREFFYATPEEVREGLLDMGNDHVLSFTSEPEAPEWRASDPSRRQHTDSETPEETAVLVGADGDLSDDGEHA